jgi:tetratricopeptide (TPR) repeat protein
MATCDSITRKGTKCKREALKGRRYCWQHESSVFRGITLVGITAFVLGVIGLAANLASLGVPIPTLKNEEDPTATSQSAFPTALPDTLLILVADFAGKDKDEDYRVTKNIVAGLYKVQEKYDEVQIVQLREVVERQEDAIVHNPETAIAEGRKLNAFIVIWGSYGVTAEAVQLDVHFEVLKRPKDFPQLGDEVKGKQRIAPILDLTTFQLQTKLSSEMTYLSLFTMGMVSHANSHWDEAIVRYTDALSQTISVVPALDRSMIHLNRGNAFYYRGDREDALLDWSEAIRLRPDYAKGYHNRGVFYAERMDHELALQDLNKALELDPNLPETYTSLGNVYDLLGDTDRSLSSYEQALRLKPNLPLVYFNRGLVYTRIGRCGDAISDFSEAIRLRPDYATAYNSRGVCHETLGNIDSAIQDYDKSIEINPELPNSRINRGNAHLSQGNLDLAIQEYTEAIRLAPTSELAYFGRGIAYYSKGQSQNAILDLEQVLQISRDPEMRQQAEDLLKELSSR